MAAAGWYLAEQEQVSTMAGRLFMHAQSAALANKRSQPFGGQTLMTAPGLATQDGAWDVHSQRSTLHAALPLGQQHGSQACGMPTWQEVWGVWGPDCHEGALLCRLGLYWTW